MTMPIIIQTTVEDRENGRHIADTLLSENLVACCQLSGPIESRYRWQGTLEAAQEFQLSLKTFESHFQRIAEIIEREHSYDVPEIIATELVHVSQSYLRWMKEEVAE